MRVPTSTYRLQVNARFTLHDAAATLPYLHDLGVDWVYLSPLLKAEPGSDHGYDVVDHSLVDPDRGGREGLAAVSAEAKRLGMGVLVDIVPNHVGVATPRENAWWWDLLRRGRRSSRFADAFDVDWEAGGGRVRIPVLGDDGGSAIEIDAAEGVVRYHDHVFPLAPGTTTLEEQHYELVHWTVADTGLNYRRFFAVTTLAGIRVEDRSVLDDSHVEIRRWFDEGLVDGLRVDHPDGLRDPATYLDDLSELTGGAYVLVEKILEPGETLPGSWATAGTTGYDVLGLVDRVLTDPDGQAPLTTLETRLRGVPLDFHELIHDTKRAVADGILGSEVRRVVRELVSRRRRSRGAATRRSRRAGSMHAGLSLVPAARARAPRLGVRAKPGGGGPTSRRRCGRRGRCWSNQSWQWPTALPADQRRGDGQGGGGLRVLPDLQAHLADRGGWRPERVVGHRRRVPRGDGGAAARTAARDDDHVDARHQAGRGRAGPDRRTGRDPRPLGRRPRHPALARPSSRRVVRQPALAGGPRRLAASRERLHGYAEKAMREAGDRTTWTAPDATYETAVHAAVDAAFDHPAVAAVLEGLLEHVAGPGWSNSLSTKLVALTMPGVPDVYQGSELWEQSLVDPDNRRPVDLGVRRQVLARVLAGERPVLTPHVADPGHAKLLVTQAALTLRRNQPHRFTTYLPVRARGEAGEHVLAFDRGGALTVATRLPIGLAACGWGETVLPLPEGAWADLLTGREHSGDAPLHELLADYPVALLLREEAG